MFASAEKHLCALERGRPLPLLGFLHPDNREPDGLKITQRFPILSSFGTASSVCFDPACAPTGTLRVIGGHFLSHGPLIVVLTTVPKHAQMYSKIGRGERKKACHFSELRTRWPSRNALNDSVVVLSWIYLFFYFFCFNPATSEDEFLEELCTHPEHN